MPQKLSITGEIMAEGPLLFKWALILSPEIVAGNYLVNLKKFGIIRYERLLEKMDYTKSIENSSW